MTKTDNRSAMMIRLRRKSFRAFAVALSGMALASCAIIGGGGKQVDPVTVYAPNVQVAAGADWPQVTWSLSIAAPTAPQVIDSTRILVRPKPDEIEIYRGASWSQPAPMLLENAVLQALDDSGKIRAVARQTSGIRADDKLVLDIRRFEADYNEANADVPAVVIEVNAKLFASDTQDVIASRTFRRAQQADGKEVKDVAAAFERSLNAITADIAGWTLHNGK